MKKTDINKFFDASKKLKDLNPFEEALVPRYAIIDAVEQELNTIKKSIPANKKTPEIEQGIKLAEKLIDGQRKIYAEIKNMRDLHLVTGGIHDKHVDIESFVNGVNVFMDTLRSAQK